MGFEGGVIGGVINYCLNIFVFSRYYRRGSNLVLDAGPYAKALEVSSYLF